MVVVYEALEIYFFSYDYKTHRSNPSDFLDASDDIVSIKCLFKTLHNGYYFFFYVLN